MAKLSSIIAFTTTTVFFVLEDLLLYNIGKTGKITFRKIPSLGEFLRIVAVVMFFALMSILVAVFLSEFVD